MKIKKILDKLEWLLDNIFRRNRQTMLINLRDIVPEFKREDFADASKIDEYKNEYLNSLNQNKTILLKDLTDDEIKSKMEMIIDLFILNCPREANITPKSVFQEEAKNRIISLKLKTYLKEVEDLLIDIKYRLVAVGEILNDIIYKYEKHGGLSFKNKINVLKSLVNSLESNLICVENQDRALKMSLKTYEDKSEFAYSLIDKDEFSDPEKIIDGHLSLRWKAVSKDLKLIPSLEDAIINSNCDVLSKIVLGEIILEKYVYQNRIQIDIYRDEVNHLEQKLNKIMKEAYRDDLSKDERRKVLNVQFGDTYFGKIREIEKIYLLFQKYSRNIVRHSDLEKLYKVNFWLMFYDVEYWGYIFVLRDEHPLECSVYENIVLDIINTVITDKNGFVFREFGMHTADAIKWIDKYLKDGEKSYSIYDNILQDSEKMRFLLYVYFGLGVRQFFENELYANNLELGLLENSLFSTGNFIHTINLISYFKALHWVQLINKEIGCYKNLIYFRKMFDLLEQIENGSGIYSLPDCITTIEYNYTHEKESDLLIDDINTHAINKKVIFPPSLKRIDVNSGLLRDIPIAGIYLNDGLEEISSGSFESVPIEYLSLPASIRSLSSTAFDYKSIKVLEFRDYTKSALKGNYKTLGQVVESFILDGKGLEKDADDLSDEISYFKRSLDNSTNLETLVFTDEELDEPIIIKLNELKDIKIIYDRFVNSITLEVECFPLINLEDIDDTTNIIKSIEEKVKIKRKKMHGKILRK